MLRKKIFAGLFFSFALFSLGSQRNSIYLLGMFCLLQAALIYFWTRPIQQIVDTLSPEKGPENEYNRLSSAFNVLHDRIQKEKESSALQQKETAVILESLSEGILAADTSAQVTFANQAARDFLTSAELWKKCYEMILHALQTSETATYLWHVEPNRYLLLVSRPLPHLKGALLVLQDKTSDYKMIEVGKDFVANASHELRTPITIIRGFAETLQDVPDLSEEMRRTISTKIVSTCDRLDKLVKSLLTLADIEQHSQERLKKTDFVFLVEQCKHFFFTAHPEAQVEMENSFEELLVLADADLFEQAILNVMENAVKYSPSPAKIVLSIEKTENSAHLKVRDFGIGIKESDLSQIFNRFYTVDKARSRKLGGAGLGLSIVKMILEKHKGSVTATSEPGQGSTFTLTLPYSK